MATKEHRKSARLAKHAFKKDHEQPMNINAGVAFSDLRPKMLEKIRCGIEILEDVATKEHRKSARLAKYLFEKYQEKPTDINAGAVFSNLKLQMSTKNQVRH